MSFLEGGGFPHSAGGKPQKAPDAGKQPGLVLGNVDQEECRSYF